MNRVGNLPDFLIEIHNVLELIDAQHRLFAKGYTWGGGGIDWDSQVWYPEMKLKYPLYISNLPATKYTDYVKINSKFIYYDDNINVFDVKLVRKFKLNVLDKSSR